MKCCLAVLVVLASASAHAERTITVRAEGAPFAATDLASALRVRLPDGAPLAVIVEPAGASRIRVAVGDTTRELDLGDRHGPDAARMVALEIVDLALDDLAVMPPPEARTRFAIDVLGSATAWTGMLAGGTADLSIARGSVAFALELAAGERVIGDLHVTSLPVRASIGWRSSWGELRAGAVVAPVVVSDGIGDQTLLAGATASARLHVGRVVLAAGTDAFATQTTYHLRMSTITTPWFAPWVAVGMELVP
ncbi:MAG: hypothetical protein JO257_35935 [Deltaproteobacteria bacterium]|nr:hypothetical protein [Deltaproteobacteria bacterium]